MCVVVGGCVVVRVVCCSVMTNVVVWCVLVRDVGCYCVFTCGVVWCCDCI